jgi:hypothetical protein
MDTTPSLFDHPYFFADSHWQAEGWYVEQGGAVVSCGGGAAVRHEDGFWIIESELRLLLINQPDMVLSLSYAMEAPQDGDSDCFWSAESVPAGPLNGRMSVIGDAVVSVGFSDDGLHGLSEYMILTDDDTYESRGLITKEGDVLGRWAVTLTAVS